MDFFHNEISSSSTPDAAVFFLLLLWNWQAYWILPLPRILLVYWPLYIYACMLSSVANERHHPLDDVGFSLTPYSASGATSFTCAYCQASPAALVPSPSSGVPLSSLNHLIWSNIHGDLNFRVHVVLYPFILPCFSRSISGVLIRRAKCEVRLK